MNPLRQIAATIESDQGRGNLDARAYFASVVGPLRAVYGKNTSQILTEAKTTQLLRSTGATVQWAYVTVVLPGNTPGPKVGLFSSNASNGFNSALPVTLQRTMGFAGGNAFAATVAPGEMLYARSAPGQGDFPVVVSVVWF